MKDDLPFVPGNVTIDYTNHAGVRALREIVPVATGFRFGSTEWHPELQWLLEAHDVAKDDLRTFAMKDIHCWHPDPQQVRVDAALAKQLQRSMERNARMVNRLKKIVDTPRWHSGESVVVAIESVLKDEEPTW